MEYFTKILCLKLHEFCAFLEEKIVSHCNSVSVDFKGCLQSTIFELNVSIILKWYICSSLGVYPGIEKKFLYHLNVGCFKGVTLAIDFQYIFSWSCLVRITFIIYLPFQLVFSVWTLSYGTVKKYLIIGTIFIENDSLLHIFVKLTVGWKMKTENNLQVLVPNKKIPSLAFRITGF